jgi:hypothetical protein
MIIISEEEMNAGWRLAKVAAECNYTVSCLFGNLDRSKKRSCSSRCLLLDFRIAFEHTSPGIFGKFREFAEYEAVTHDLYLVEQRGIPAEKQAMVGRLQDLMVFVQIVLSALYPLFLANGKEAPHLSSKEISKIMAENSKPEIKAKRAYEFLNINNDWFHWIGFYANSIENKNYISRIFLLIDFFVEGMKKKLPPEEFSSDQEKEDFFSEIEGFLGLKKQESD